VASPAVEALETWREAERVLDALPPASPDHETVALLVYEMRSMYQRLTDSGIASAEVLTASLETLEAARSLLRRLDHPD
jgi:hypothetical protein